MQHTVHESIESGSAVICFSKNLIYLNRHTKGTDDFSKHISTWSYFAIIHVLLVLSSRLQMCDPRYEKPIFVLKGSQRLLCRL